MIDFLLTVQLPFFNSLVFHFILIHYEYVLDYHICISSKRQLSKFSLLTFTQIFICSIYNITNSSRAGGKPLARRRDMYRNPLSDPNHVRIKIKIRIILEKQYALKYASITFSTF